MNQNVRESNDQMKQSCELFPARARPSRSSVSRSRTGHHEMKLVPNGTGFFHAVFLLEIEPEFRKNYLVQNYQPQYLICNPQNQSFSELFRTDNAM